MSTPSDSWAWPDKPRILVAGAGAIGCSLATRLAVAGLPVSLLARGATLAAVQAQGLRLDDLDGAWQARVHAASSAQGLEAADLLFLCCKSQDLPALAAQVRPLITPRTLIVPCVNGVPFWYFHRSGDRFEGETVRAVDPDGRLGTLLPLEQVLGAVVFITADTPSPAHAVSRTPHLVMLGEPGGGITPRLQAACAVLAAAGIEARPLERIRDKLWTKLIANLTSNPLSVVTGATLQAIYTEPALLATVRQVMHEAMLAASCYGARLEIDPIEFVRLGAAMGPVRTSMLQDHERGRPLELAAIGDALIELGERYALPMAATRALVAQARRRNARGSTEEASLSLATPT
jgi:2-dehydropantoate 2-reductase